MCLYAGCHRVGIDKTGIDNGDDSAAVSFCRIPGIFRADTAPVGDAVVFK